IRRRSNPGSGFDRLIENKLHRLAGGLSARVEAGAPVIIERQQIVAGAGGVMRKAAELRRVAGVAIFDRLNGCRMQGPAAPARQHGPASLRKQRVAESY